MTREEQFNWDADEDSFAADFRLQEQREYDYKLKLETLENFKQFIEQRMGPNYITNNDREQWLKDNS